MRKRIFMTMQIFILLVIGSFSFSMTVEAAFTTEQKKEYINALSNAIQNGVEKQKMDIYKEISQSTAGKACFQEAVQQNRIALMAEGIDFLDTNWTQYYKVNTKGKHTMFRSVKTVTRKSYQKRYQNIVKGLKEVLACVEPSMSDADKAMAVYQYLARNTVYKKSGDCHTGYDVLVKHTGVCDGLSNAYALAMETLGVPCAVVTNYAKDHSWNIVKINGVWYLCDLTIGAGLGNHEGMVVSWSSCLVGTSAFLETHPGYKKNDLYGQGNSNGLNLRKIRLAESDYIPGNSAIKNALEDKTCTFYQSGYWYWVSSGNILKRSKLNGKSASTVYTPADDAYIGWIEEYNGWIYLSLNDAIYRMNYNGKHLKKVLQVSSGEYYHEVSSFFWQLAYVGRFFLNSSGRMGYYISDLRSVKKGRQTVSLLEDASNPSPKLSKKTLSLRAGYKKQLYVINLPNEKVQGVKWKSSAPSIARVDQNGMITAKKQGTATITAVYKNIRLKCRIKVTGYTITYKKAGVNASGNPAAASGNKKIVLKNPEKEGYIFKGWYEDKTCRRRIKIIKKGNKKNMTLYAKWQKK